jgi:hypothetical protein
VLKFNKDLKKSKEWKTMKLTVQFDNGMELTIKPEHASLIDNNGKAVLVTRTENAVIPILFFNAALANADELKAREAAAAKKAAIEKANVDAKAAKAAIAAAAKAAASEDEPAT